MMVPVAPLIPPIASISSTKMIQGALTLARLKRSLILAAPTPKAHNKINSYTFIL